jgi:serine/threonine protein kinase
LKPQYIFLTQKNKIVKIGDFGVTQQLSGTLIEAQTTVGTPYYMSPELITGKSYTQKNDVWAIGAILSEICSTEVPFNARNIRELSNKIREMDPTPIPESYGPEIKRIIDWMLSKKQEDRPLMRDLMKDPFMIWSMKDSKERLGAFLNEPTSEGEMEQLKDKMNQLRSTQKKNASRIKENSHPYKSTRC